MRVGVIDIGSNSIRLLVADLGDGDGLTELARESRVTRLGRGVESGGVLSDEAIAQTSEAIADYAEQIDQLGAERAVAIATSAVRDAANGREFLAGVGQRFAIETRLLDGEQEARISYAGAGAGRSTAELALSTLVVDIGGGSTELIVGAGGEVRFHDSLQLGVVRHSERHIHSDPPTAAELEALGADAQDLIAAATQRLEERPELCIALAGTATSLAAIDLGLEPYDPARVHGRLVDRERIAEILARLTALTEPERRRVPGLHSDRAPTIIPGIVILLCVLDAFELDQIEVSERDGLWGAALEQLHT